MDDINFNEIPMSIENLSTFNIFIKEGGSNEQMTFEGEKDFLESINIQANNTKIIISNKKSLISNKKLNQKLIIYLPSVLSIKHSGSGTISVQCPVLGNVENNRSGSLIVEKKSSIKEITNKSTGSIKIYDLHTDELKIDTSGTSNTQILKGKIDILHAEASGISTVNIQASVKHLFVNSSTVEKFEAHNVINTAEIHNNSLGSMYITGTCYDECYAVNEGIGEIHLNNLETSFLDLSNNGIGDIIVSGVAENISEKNTGIGSIEKRYLQFSNISKKVNKTKGKKKNNKKVPSVSSEFFSNSIPFSNFTSNKVNEDIPTIEKPLTQEQKKRLNRLRKLL